MEDRLLQMPLVGGDHLELRHDFARVNDAGTDVLLAASWVPTNRAFAGTAPG